MEFKNIKEFPTGGKSLTKIYHSGGVVWEGKTIVDSTLLKYTETKNGYDNCPLLVSTSKEYINTSVSKTIYVKLPRDVFAFAGHTNSETYIECNINSIRVDNNYLSSIYNRDDPPMATGWSRGVSVEKSDSNYVYLKYNANFKESNIALEFTMAYYKRNGEEEKSMMALLKKYPIKVANNMNLLK